AVVGPMQLFMPQDASAKFGAGVWILLVTFYVLCLTLVTMLSRPRLVIYNIGRAELREVLAETARRLDHESVWAGDALAMPQMRVQLRLENFAPLGNASLVSIGAEQSVGGWRRLELALRRSLMDVPAASSTRGLWLVFCGLAMLAFLARSVIDNPQTI